MLEVKVLVKLHNLRILHVTIWSELTYVTGAKVAGTDEWNQDPGSSQPKNRGYMSGPGTLPAKTRRFWLLGGPWPGPQPSILFQPGPKWDTPEGLLMSIDLIAALCAMVTTQW